MKQVAGYLVSYSDARTIVANLQIPVKGVDDIWLQHPINDWLAMKKRYNIVCTTVGHIYSYYRDANGVFLITHVRTVRRRGLMGGETLTMRDKDEHVKRWLVEEGGAKEDSLQWTSFPGGDKLGMLFEGIRPKRNDFHGPWTQYELTDKQGKRMFKSGKDVPEWTAEAIANGEWVKRIWPPQEDPSHPEGYS